MARGLRRILALVLLIGCISCDQGTKRLAVEHLAGEPPRDYLGGFLSIRYAENTGAFLGLGADWPAPARLAVFVVLTGAILTAAAWTLLRRRALSLVERVGFLLLLAGGIGNLFDRVRLGYVVDFLNIGIGSLRTGIFNVADMAIMTGVFALFIAPSFVPRADPAPTPGR